MNAYAESTSEGWVLVTVPAGTKHNFVNTGPNPLVLYTVY